MSNNDKTKKKLSLDSLDSAAEKKGEGTKTLWQILKFLVVSGLVTVIQLVLVNVLYFAFKEWKAPLPSVLAGIFTAETVGAGNDNWGYVLPFFVSNLAANIYGYIQNKKTTFKSDAPAYCFAIYLGLMAALILFSTWMQGVVANALTRTQIAILAGLAPTIAALSAGLLQMLILFPMEKYVLLKEKKE